jgi:hypothetical protein
VGSNEAGRAGLQALVPDACLASAASLFAALHAAPTLDNAERLAQWLGADARHARALDIALTEWGLVRSGHPVGEPGDLRGPRGSCGGG